MPQKNMCSAFVRRRYSGLSSFTDTPYLFPRKWKLSIFWLLVGVKWYSRDVCAAGRSQRCLWRGAVALFPVQLASLSSMLPPDVPQTCWACDKRVTMTDRRMRPCPTPPCKTVSSFHRTDVWVTHTIGWGGWGALSSQPGFESEDGIAFQNLGLCCVVGTLLGKPEIFWLSPHTPKQRPSCLRTRATASQWRHFQKMKCKVFTVWGQNKLGNQYKHPAQSRRPAAVMQAWCTGPWMMRETALAQPGRLSIVNSFVCHCPLFTLPSYCFYSWADLRPRKNSLYCAESGSQRDNRNKCFAA